jgi:hypothetical protein
VGRRQKAINTHSAVSTTEEKALRGGKGKARRESQEGPSRQSYEGKISSRVGLRRLGALPDGSGQDAAQNLGMSLVLPDRARNLKVDQVTVKITSIRWDDTCVRRDRQKEHMHNDRADRFEHELQITGRRLYAGTRHLLNWAK